MKPTLRITLSFLALPVVVGVAYLLDRWVLALTANPFDGSYAWATSLSLLTISLILLALSWLVLGHRPVSRYVAIIYLLVGLLLTLIQPLVLSAYLNHSTKIFEVLAMGGPLFSLPCSLLLKCGTVSHFTFAFLAAMGVGALIPRHFFSIGGKP